MKSKLTILTVVKDGLDKLPDTLKSVAIQFNQPYEHIVCVGMPDDGSLDYLSKYNEHFIKINEINDNGLYDALNQGIALSSGDYILFLHAGDQLVNRNFIGIYDDLVTSNPDIMYGNVQFSDKNGEVKRKWNSGEYKEYKVHLGWMPPHTCSIVKTSIYEKFGLFDQSYKISADYKFLFKIMRAKKSFLYANELLIDMEIGGVSTLNFNSHFTKILEDFRAIEGTWLYSSFVVLAKRLRKVHQIRK